MEYTLPKKLLRCLARVECASYSEGTRSGTPRPGTTICMLIPYDLAECSRTTGSSVRNDNSTGGLLKWTSMPADNSVSTSESLKVAVALISRTLKCIALERSGVQRRRRIRSFFCRPRGLVFFLVSTPSEKPTSTESERSRHSAGSTPALTRHPDLARAETRHERPSSVSVCKRRVWATRCTATCSSQSATPIIIVLALHDITTDDS